MSYYRGAMVALVSSCVEAVSFIVTSFAAAVGVVSAKLYSCVALPQACGVKPSRYEPPCRSQRRSFGTAPRLFVLRSATQSRLISFRNCWRRGVSEPLTLPVGRGGVRVDRSDAIARRWLRVHCGINVRSKIDNAADLERDWGSRIREQLALPSYSEATTAGQLFNLLEQRRPRVNTISASEAHIHTRSCATPTTNSGSATSSRSSSHIDRPGICNHQGHGLAGRAPGS